MFDVFLIAAYCDKKGPLNVICEDISGDAPLFSMFRQDPPPKAQPCPFKSAPFTFSYNRYYNNSFVRFLYMF